MNSRSLARILVLLALGCFAAALAACSGGKSSTTTPITPGQINQGSGNNPPPLFDGSGPTQYNGNPGTTGGKVPAPGTTVDAPGSWDFGNNIFRVPVDSQGTARVVAQSFSPGQKVAFVVINMNPQYLDAHATGTSGFPVLPQSSYTVQADLVSKGPSSVKATGGGALQSLTSLTPGSELGMKYTGQKVSPLTIYEREARAQGQVPYAVIPSKGVSSIQKGEIRTFINTPPRSITLPPILPGPVDPNKDTSMDRWPNQYNSQDGRLVSVGQHCLIFLSTAINDGHPDNIRFTQTRLNRMAQEFDTKIFPIDQTVYGPVSSYADGSIWRDIDRAHAPLTGDDFDNNHKLLVTLPGEVDNTLVQEQKIIIFLFDGAEGGFFTYGPAVDKNDRAKLEGSTLYIGTDNFPPDDNDFNAAFSVMAHEFQHKLFHDNGLPERNTSYGWFNEGLSMMAMYACGYTPNSGKLIHWVIDSQVVDFEQQSNAAPVPMDANPYFSNQAQYGSGFLFFVYMFEHYDPGVGNRIYAASRAGQRDPIKLIEAGAQATTTNAGPDGLVGTADDYQVTTHDSFEQIYSKFAIALFVDGIYASNTALFDDRFHYNTLDLRGTVKLSSGTIQLPGVRTGVFPDNGSYPVIANDRLVYPWAMDYLVFGNGDGRDLQILFSADPNFKVYMLPVAVPRDSNGQPIPTNTVTVTAGAQLPY